MDSDTKKDGWDVEDLVEDEVVRLSVRRRPLAAVLAGETAWTFEYAVRLDNLTFSDLHEIAHAVEEGGKQGGADLHKFIADAAEKLAASEQEKQAIETKH